jgi:hypothetical protein
VTRAERRDLDCIRRDARKLMRNPHAQERALKALNMVEHIESRDPRPSLLLRWRLRLARVDAG